MGIQDIIRNAKQSIRKEIIQHKADKVTERIAKDKYRAAYRKESVVSAEKRGQLAAREKYGLQTRRVTTGKGKKRKTTTYTTTAKNNHNSSGVKRYFAAIKEKNAQEQKQQVRKTLFNQ